MATSCWLMKAEPESRIVRGKDVKVAETIDGILRVVDTQQFSVDDFEAVGTTPWEGVRNAEARNIMKEMKTGDKLLFYHSSCKQPGIAAFAEVAKEAYPDYTAWDPTHPYYDPKTDKENPKWYMVDVTFTSRAAHFVPLSLLRRIAAAPSPSIPDEVAYIGPEGADAIKEMALVKRGRLSVQRVEEQTWSVIEKLAERGGWDQPGTKTKRAGNASGGKGKGKRKDGDADADAEEAVTNDDKPSAKVAGTKRKQRGEEDEAAAPTRRSTRARKPN